MARVDLGQSGGQTARRRGARRHGARLACAGARRAALTAGTALTDFVSITHRFKPIERAPYCAGCGIRGVETHGLRRPDGVRPQHRRERTWPNATLTRGFDKAIASDA